MTQSLSFSNSHCPLGRGDVDGGNERRQEAGVNNPELLGKFDMQNTECYPQRIPFPLHPPCPPQPHRALFHGGSHHITMSVHTGLFFCKCHSYHMV